MPPHAGLEVEWLSPSHFEKALEIGTPAYPWLGAEASCVKRVRQTEQFKVRDRNLTYAAAFWTQSDQLRSHLTFDALSSSHYAVVRYASVCVKRIFGRQQPDKPWLQVLGKVGEMSP